MTLKSEAPFVTLIMSTYNRPEALELCLLSALAQNYSNFEIIVADDGSKKETKDLVESFKKTSSIPIVHVWHPDEGFQLSKIRNRAIAASRGTYIVSIDADQILHPNFITDHVQVAKKGSFLQGHRVLLSKEKTDEVFSSKKLSFSILETGIRNKKNMFRSEFLMDIFSCPHKKVRGVRGSNMSFWKEDLIQVNGFNEKFVGWGREDTELVIRLYNSGIKRRDLYFSGIAYHLYHPEYSRKSLESNDDILNQTILNKLSTCEKGVSQYVD